MRKNSLYSFIILLVFLGFLFLQNKDKLTKSMTQSESIVQNVNKNKPTHITNTTTKKDTNIKISNDIIETTIFSEDPLVDKFIMIHKFRYCIKNYKISTSKNYKTKKEKMFQEHYLYCDKIQKKHPEYRLKNNNWKDYKKMPISNSYLGRLFSENEFHKSPDYDLKRIIKEAKNISPDLLLADQFIFMYEYFKNTEHRLMEILQSHQLDYVRTISSYAQDLYACNNGADCGKNSTLMLTHCMVNQNFCMDDYELLIKTKLSQGQQADVALAYQFYESFFNVD